MSSLIPRRGSIRRSAARFSSLRWAALPITDRRWTVPLSAGAVGMGLFIGVAIGPGAENTLGTGPPTVVVQAPEPLAPPQVAAAPKHDAPGDHAADIGGRVATAPPPSPSPPVDSTGGAIAPPISTPPVSSTPPVTTTTPSVTADQTTTTTTETKTEPKPVKLHGTVVRLNRPAASYVLAAPRGEIRAVHSRDLPTLGNTLEVKARQLANGTYVEEGERARTGSHDSARVEGAVTFVDRDTGAYTLSSTGASLLIHPDGDQGKGLPRVGAQVVVSASIVKPVSEGTEVNAPPPTDVPAPRRSGGCGDAPRPPRPPDEVLTEVSRRVSAQYVETASAEGIVQRACPDSGTLVLSADDVRESGADLEIPVPEDSGIDLSAVSPGDVVVASVTIGKSAGALTLSGIASDDGAAGADDTATQQGQQAG